MLRRSLVLRVEQHDAGGLHDFRGKVAELWKDEDGVVENVILLCTLFCTSVG